MSTNRYSAESRKHRHLTVEAMEDRLALSASPFNSINIETIDLITDASHDTVLTSTAAPGEDLETLALLVPTTGNNTYNAMTGLNDVKNLYGLDGSGQTVVVIDSGIAYSHVDLGGGFGESYRVVGGYDFANDDWDPYDAGPRGSHGTHVAGIIGSTSTQYSGVATGVDLVALRIFNDDGTADMQCLIDALQWVHENKDAFENPITTINLSVGFQVDSNDYFARIDEWFRILNDDGIFISVAAGNSFETIADKSQLSYPAMSEYVVSVGSVGINGEVSYFSQRSESTIMAPGQYVKSAVPDYVGNRNGIDDDYSTFSGTSMAAPYVAGAGTLIRQAMQMVGMTDITPQKIYDIIVATADKIYDAVTGLCFSRLNVKNAIESILPAETFGSTIDDATGLGTIVDTLAIEGFFNTKTDKDYFSFVAARDGTIVLTPEMSAGLTGTWDLGAVPDAILADDGTVTLHVTAGDTYTLGFNATGKIGVYTLNARYTDRLPEETDTGEKDTDEKDTDTTPHPDNPIDDTDIDDIGIDVPGIDVPGIDDPGIDEQPAGTVSVTVDQTTLDNQRLTEGGRWYAVTATHTGTMTFEVVLPTGVSGQKVIIEIGDADGHVTTIYDGHTRIDFDRIAGTTTWVRVRTESDAGSMDGATIRLTNLVRQVGSEVFIVGTATGDDDIALIAGTTHLVLINGVLYSFDAGRITNVNIDARGGDNTVRYTGSGANANIVIDGTTATMTDHGLTLGISNVQNLEIDGNGGWNTFRYYATEGDDRVTIRPGEVTIESDHLTARVGSVTNFFAYTNHVGNASAILYDSPGNDTLTVSATYALFKSGGMTSWLYSFQSLVAYSVNGGRNTATMTDTTGETSFVGSAESVKRYSDNRYVEVRGYTQVNLTGVFGGKNAVRLEAVTGDDTLSLMADGVSLNGTNYGISVRGFDHVHTSAVGGGNGKIMIYDAHKAEKIVAAKNMISVIDSLHTYSADGFEEIWAFGNNKENSRIENHGTDYVLNLLGQWEDELATKFDTEAG